MKYLLAACLMAIYTLGAAQTDSNSAVSKSSTKKIYSVKDVEYIGEETLTDFIDDNLNTDVKKYIRKNNLQNKIYAEMNINTKGEVTDVLIPGEQDYFVSNELIRVLMQTHWRPASNNGNPIHRKILVPVAFKF